MPISVSNIAWNPSDDDPIADALLSEGVTLVEIAPTVRWPDLLDVTKTEAAEYRSEWQRRGLNISSLQALLYGRPDLRLFGSRSARAQTLEYLSAVCRLGGWLGAEALVFGSPRNRHRGELARTEAEEIAAAFFGELAVIASEANTVVCLEPNPEVYGTNFMTNVDEAAAVVRLVDHPGVRLHLDTACMHLAGDDPAEAVSRNIDILGHTHVSEPNLGPVGVVSDVPHGAMAAALREESYDKVVSVEMRATDDAIDAVSHAIRFVVGEYGPP